MQLDISAVRLDKWLTNFDSATELVASLLYDLKKCPKHKNLGTSKGESRQRE